jgi:membrane-associated phospholipid phosphatase
MIETVVCGGIVVVGLILAVSLETYTPHELAYFAGIATLAILYVLHSRRGMDADERRRTLPRVVFLNLALLVVLLFVNYLYGVSNQPIGTTHSMKSSLDPWAVVPEFTPFYLGFYAFIIFTLAYLATRALHTQFTTLLFGLIFAMVIGLGTFVIFQTYVPPPPIEGPEPFRSMLAYVENDLYAGNFYSCFPSLHCGYSMLLAIAWVRIGRRVLSTVCVVFAVMVMLATQFLHQHYFLDLVYGDLLAIASYTIGWLVVERRPWRRTGIGEADAGRDDAAARA